MSGPQTTHDLRLERARPNARRRRPATARRAIVCSMASVKLGVWRDPEHSAARFLVDNGLAGRGDMIRTFRGDVMCMTGSVGWFADRMTKENDRVGPVTVKWMPFPVRQVLAGRL